jgi:hypothetical protein
MKQQTAALRSVQSWVPRKNESLQQTYVEFHLTDWRSFSLSVDGEVKEEQNGLVGTECRNFAF